jgi:hypothetical protein
MDAPPQMPASRHDRRRLDQDRTDARTLQAAAGLGSATKRARYTSWPLSPLPVLHAGRVARHDRSRDQHRRAAPPQSRCGVACLISPHGGNTVPAAKRSCLRSRGRLPEIVRVTLCQLTRENTSPAATADLGQTADLGSVRAWVRVPPAPQNRSSVAVYTQRCWSVLVSGRVLSIRSWAVSLSVPAC